MILKLPVEKKVPKISKLPRKRTASRRWPQFFETNFWKTAVPFDFIPDKSDWKIFLPVEKYFCRSRNIFIAWKITFVTQEIFFLVETFFVGWEYYPTLTHFVMYRQYFLLDLMPALTFTFKLLVLHVQVLMSKILTLHLYMLKRNSALLTGNFSFVRSSEIFV